MKRILIGFSASLIVLGFMPVVALAQTAAMTPYPVPACLSIGPNMRVGALDASTGGSVSALQSFLTSTGYFNAAYLGSSRFGPLTLSALVRFQVANGLPGTGYAGPMTRALIQKITCGGGVIVFPTQILSISHLTPASGQVGATVTIVGNGFTSSNTILMNGSIVASNVPLNPVLGIACPQYDSNCSGNRQSITFTIPSYIAPYCAPGMYCTMMVQQVTPGPYSISIQNSNGTSNTMTLQVTGKFGEGISINGLDAPTSLTIGQQGTWTVQVAGSQNTGNLRYSVVWGDEYQDGVVYIQSPQDASVQSSATFTHTYRISGTYKPTFTVTRDDGATNSVSATVLVNPIY